MALTTHLGQQKRIRGPRSRTLPREGKACEAILYDALGPTQKWEEHGCEWES